MDVKYTPERREAFKRVVDAARRFVRTADEFSDDFPEACGEDLQALEEALDDQARAWDEGPDAPPVALEVETVEPPTSERVTRTG